MAVDTLWVAEGVFLTLLLEAGEARRLAVLHPAEEVLVGRLQILEGLLQHLRVDFAQPGRLLRLLQFGEHLALVGLGEGLALRLVARLPG